MPFRVDCLQFSTLVDRCIANYRLGDARAVCKITSVVITTPVFICFFSYFICFEPQGNVTIQRYRTERYCIEIYLIKTTGQCNHKRSLAFTPLTPSSRRSPGYMRCPGSGAEDLIDLCGSTCLDIDYVPRYLNTTTTVTDK